MLQNIHLVYFSPTGGTKRAAIYLSENLAKNINEIDLSSPKYFSKTFEGNDIVLFAAPVFGGRIPDYVAEKLKTCHGNSTTAITIVVYGNRAYDDAVLELNDVVKAQGFQILASAAVIAKHAMASEIAVGRPDKEDYLKLKEYADKILEKFKNKQDSLDISVPGKRPYITWNPIHVIPLVSNNCTKCGMCAIQCPTQAISNEDPKITNPLKCILCMRCISNCPKKARSLPAPIQQVIEQKLSPLKNIRRENELFI